MTGLATKARAVALLEREGELAHIGELLGQARAGAGRVLLVEGPAGAGKTRLLEECRARCTETEVVALLGRGGDLEREFPYGVARQLLEPPLREASKRVREELLADAAGLAASVLALSGAEAGDAAGSEFAAMHGLYWLVANLAARHPLLIAVDDAHLCDLPSLRFLAYLAHRIEALPVLVTLVRRQGEPGPQADLISRLSAEPGVDLLQPAPLSPEATGRLVRGVLGESAADEFCAACYSTTGGNPFLLHELLSGLAADQVQPTAQATSHVVKLRPSSVARSVLLRLARLPAQATKLARAVAVLGATTAELRHAAALAELDLKLAAEGVDSLVAMDILRPGRTLDFVHPIVRAAVYDGLPEQSRALAHGQAARLLAADDARPEEVGAHLLLCQPASDAWAVEALRAAGRDALARAAPEAAVRFLRRALEEPPAPEVRADVLLELGRAEARADLGGAEHIAQALELTTGPARRAEIALSLGGVLGLAGAHHQAVEVLEPALAELDGSPADRPLALRLESELIGLSLIRSSTLPVAVERLPRVAATVTGSTPPERLLLAMASHGLTVAGQITAEQAAGAARAVVRSGGLAGEENTSLVFFTAMTLVYADELDAAVAVLDEVIDDARARGSLPQVAIASAFRAEALRRRGSVLDAELDARASIELVEPSVLGLNLPFALAFLVEVLIERDLLDDAKPAVAGAQLDESAAEVWQSILLLHSRGRLRIAQGRLSEGLQDVLEAGRRLRPWGMRNPSAVPWRSTAALALLALGDRQEAEKLADKELEQARAFAAPRALGVALRAKALVTGGEKSIDLLQEAVARLEKSPAAVELARALCDLGAAIRRTGHPAAAREPLTRGLDLAHRCGASALERRVRDELAAAGARPRRTVLSGVESLTPSERRVAWMAADGMTNREIAQALFVTARTVETHLTHVYQKLDIESRSELAGGLAPA